MVASSGLSVSLCHPRCQTAQHLQSQRGSVAAWQHSIEVHSAAGLKADFCTFICVCGAFTRSPPNGHAGCLLQHSCPAAKTLTWVKGCQCAHPTAMHAVGPHSPPVHVKMPDLLVSAAHHHLSPAAAGQEAGIEDVGSVALQECNPIL